MQARHFPGVYLEAFAIRTIDMATGDRNRIASSQAWVFFYRGLLGAAIALEHATGLAASSTLSGHARFHHHVFLAHPAQKSTKGTVNAYKT